MEVFKYSNIGLREVNQDYIVSQTISQDVSLHLVADGMGGYECGDIASKIVGDSYIYGLSCKMNLDESTTLASSNIEKERRNIGVSKMGSTVAGVLLKGLDAITFWAGDSRIYIFRDKKIMYQSEDHSMVNELSKLRKLTFEERKRYGHIITRSIMGNSNDRIDTREVTLRTGDEILICTDGIYKDCSVDYLAESLRSGGFDIDKHNDDFEDNHSFIFITV